MTFPVTEHTVKTDRHTTGYLASGPQDGPLLMFCHGWPELSLSWRHQLPAFAALGFRCVAPDMRGYGRSSTYTRHEDFAQELIVQDMLELLAALGRAPGHDRAVWIGHDWGSPVVWNMAAHHPDKTVGVASLCVPYIKGFTLDERTSRLAEPMRRDCADLTEVVVKSGHWMAQEKPVDVNRALVRWLATRLASYWPSEA